MSLKRSKPNEVNEDIQRGKRKTARLFEWVAIILLALAVYGFKEAQSVFILAFPAILAYSASLRGLDAKWPSDRVQRPSGPTYGGRPEYSSQYPSRGDEYSDLGPDKPY